MRSIKEVQQIKALIAKGKEKGFLTFQELNSSLPSDVNDPEQIEEIINLFQQLEISIIDEQTNKKMELVNDVELDLAEVPSVEDDELQESSRSMDPVRMYLHEMGLVPLLDREGEVRIAKKIEQGELEVLYSFAEVPVAVEYLINVGEELKKGHIKLKDVVKTIEEDDPTEEEMNQRERVITLLEEIKQIYKKKRHLYNKLDELCTLKKRTRAIAQRFLDFKNEIVERLRAIKLEKKLVDEVIEHIEDYVRQMNNCSGTILHTSFLLERPRQRSKNYLKS